jgi:hypothetical protein
MAGGYAPSIDDIVDIHSSTIGAASSFHSNANKLNNNLGILA